MRRLGVAHHPPTTAAATDSSNGRHMTDTTQPASTQPAGCYPDTKRQPAVLQRAALDRARPVRISRARRRTRPAPGACRGATPKVVVAKPLADYAPFSGWLWIAIGVVQILTVVLILVGACNVYPGITRVRGARVVEARDYRVPKSFESLTGYIVIGLLNLLFGAVLGLLALLVDFDVRDQVLKNADIFDQVTD